MKTSFKSKEEAEQSRNWVVVDAASAPVGRIATKIAHILRGKDKPHYTPHVDCGDFVVVVNASNAKFTGQKAANKKYFYHTGYVGGVKELKASELLENEPERVIQMAVKRMLPKGPLGRQQFAKLKVYRGSEHPHTAQKPVSI